MGQWHGGSEFSWAVSYDGNGQARRLLAKTAQQWNQDAVLLLKRTDGAKHDAIWEMTFDHVPLAVRTALAEPMGKYLGGWTWFKRGGQTVLRSASVPAWGSTNKAHASARVRIAEVFRRVGLPPRSVVHISGYKAEVLQRERNADGSGTTYADVLGR